MDIDASGADFCRVCRSEGTSDRPLFHPCICTGSIKWIHQECLVQWMRYSRKEFCELCGHRFSFMPIYSPDMPRRLPLKDVLGGLLTSVATAVKDWIHYTVVAIAWLGIVPLTACRTYRTLFSGSLEPILSLPFDILNAENLLRDLFMGCFVVTCTLFSFIGLVWLREQIMHGGGPNWLERDNFAPAPNFDEIAQEADNNNGPMEGGRDHLQDIPEDEALLREEALAEEPIGGDEGNWNPIEWERAAEELTWARLLGLDGSMVFLEHVFWVVSLNTLFILLFAFVPYHIGNIAAILTDLGNDSQFSGLIMTLSGYCIIGILLALLHGLAAVLRLRSAKRALGLCYVVVKVALLSVVEIGVLPLIFGWWLDICSLSMFDATLKDREENLKSAPWTLTFIHWLVGMVYVYYLASFILLLREVLRPGVLWFMKNLNDPDFSPVQEMIHLSVWVHIHRLIASTVIFGTAVIFMLWLPIRLLKRLLPGFLPYAVTVHTEAPVSELSLELLLLQVILPALLEQSHTRKWLKACVRAWCVCAAHILGLRSYLLPQATEEAGRAAPPAAVAPPAQPPFHQGLGAAHQALLRREGPAGFEPYDRPTWFPLRLFGLLVLVALSLVAGSAVTLVVPVWLGRKVMTIWLPKSADGVHELYTAACGTYVCWLIGRGASAAYSWARAGRTALLTRAKSWAYCGAKAAVAAFALILLVPLLFGLLLELVVVIPLRVGPNQTPIVFVWQDWALGVLYTKIACALTMMGPNWSMRRAIEKVYRDGLRDMQLGFVLKSVAAPVVTWLGLSLAVPYVITHTFLPMIEPSPQMRIVVGRRIYPALLTLALFALLTVIQMRQFRRLYEHIKNDKYLVGQRLVNYDHRRAKMLQQQQQAAAAMSAAVAGAIQNVAVADT